VKSRVAVLVLSLAAAAAAALWVRPAGAQAGREERWEYCVLGPAQPVAEGLRRGQYVAKITYFTSQGARTADVETGDLSYATPGSGTTAAPAGDPVVVLAQAMAVLGVNGWEIVALPSGGNLNTGIWMIGNGALFKRRVQ
jgi:hypothetical protein